VDRTWWGKVVVRTVPDSTRHFTFIALHFIALHNHGCDPGPKPKAKSFWLVALDEQWPHDGKSSEPLTSKELCTPVHWPGDSGRAQAFGNDCVEDKDDRDREREVAHQLDRLSGVSSVGGPFS